MTGRQNDLPDLPHLTLSQARAVLARIEDGRIELEEGAVVVVLVNQRRNRAKATSAARREPLPSNLKKRLSSPGLIRLGKRILDRLPNLATFYLVGRAFDGGCKSLRTVSAEFNRKDLLGILPDGIGTSFSHLSTVISGL